MRIAEIVNSLEIGGAERMLVDLACGLQARGHSLHVFCIRGGGDLSVPLEQAGIGYTTLNKSDGFSLSTMMQLAKHLKAGSFDVVHTHNPLVHHYGACSGYQAGVPVVVNTLHGISNLNGGDKTTHLFKFVARFTDSIVSVCEMAREYFITRAGIPQKKMTVIYNGIPVEKFLLNEAPKAPGPFTFGAVGRLVPVKDHASLLEAFRIVLTQQPDCVLEILGDGPLRQTLEATATRLGIAHAVKFRGASLDVPSFLQRIDTFVLSSVSEGLPLTMLEAMASGLPVVGTSVGGVPELIGATRSGWICEPSRPETMAECMVQAACSPEAQRRQMGLRGRAYVVEKCSLVSMRDAYETLFERLLSTRKRNVQ